MVQIFRNAHGVEGLHLATDCFSEEVERRIFSAKWRYRGSRNGRESGGPTGPTSWWPDDYTKLTNLIRDCGLLPGYVPPNYCLHLKYPVGSAFCHHYDSRHRWGEVIVGVNLGQSGVIYFVPKDGHESMLPPGMNSIRVTLPRRSIYIMSGASRLDWMHGIAKQQPTQPPPSWNKQNVRVSLTFRSTKVFSDVYLKRQHQIETDAVKKAELKARRDSQERFYPVREYGGAKMSKDEVERHRKKANELLDKMDRGEIRAQLRFEQHEVTFPLPAACASNGYVTNGATVAPAVAFQGGGRLLGSADDSDNEMKKAINASLRSLAEDRATRRRKKDHSGRSSSDKGIVVVDLLSDDEEDQKKEFGCNGKMSPDVIVIDD
mmetsp:Transcript_8141/g.12613  ORF Transcript_8141/g.12613 Transcript_8141/m.12613 type:complete len:376 (-) Transcript_8141:49-1176(-)